VQNSNLSAVFCCPATARPAVLEGDWLGQDGTHALVATLPVSVLEGAAEALSELPAWLAWHAEKYPAGAAIGFLSYELARFFEALPLTKRDSLPDLSFAYYPRIFRLPHRVVSPPQSFSGQDFKVRTNFDARSYAKALAKIRDYLVAGDIYQANLTQQFRVSLRDQPPEGVYDRLSTGHAPFRAYLKSPTRTIISHSPERFFRVSGRHILASPIKGTIARSGDAGGDKKKISQLLASEKDRAENIMIVDLIRNDLGRICEYHTIQAQLYEVVPLPQLFHLVSHVRGVLRAEVGLLEILRALFPCGSITGAPKIRAMEILAEIEQAPRGVSMGAIGIILGTPGSDNCAMDFNVAIRTMTIEGDAAVFNVGGGIVYDSNPVAEYEELLLKAQPLLEALPAARALEPVDERAQILGRQSRTMDRFVL